MNENEIPDPQITPQKRLRKSQLTHSRPLGDCVTLGMINIKWIINLAAWREKSEHTSNCQLGEKFSPFALA